MSAADALARIGEIDLGEEANAYRARIREWIAGHMPAGLAAARWNDTGWSQERHQAMAGPEYQEWERRLLAARLVCPTWPAQYGGGDLTPVQMLVFAEECVRAEIPRVQRGMGERMVGPALLTHGADEQKAYFLPRIISGEDVYCQGYSEPDHGSDLAAIETKGVVDGDEIVITGQKVWTSGAQQANMIFILCRTDPGAPRHRGISYVLARFAPDNGIQWSPVRQLTGDARFCQDFFDGTRAPLFNVIGGINHGWRPAMTTLGFGLRLTARMLAGGESTAEASIVKAFRTEYHRRLGQIALNLSGPAGLIRPAGEGYALDRRQEVFLSSRAGTIFSGTSEIQRNIMAERVLGLPREPRSPAPAPSA